jgi:hypothetical protein
MFWKLLNSLKPEMKNSSDSCIDLATWHTHFKNINAIPQCQTQFVAKLNDMLKGLDKVCTPFSFSFSVIFRIELKTFLSKMTIIWVKRK